MRGEYGLPGEADLRGPARFLWWLVTSQRRRIGLAATLGTVWMVGLALPPYLLSRAIDDGLQPRHFSALLGWSMALLGMGALNAYVAIMRHRTMTKVRMDAGFRTLTAVIHQATRLGQELAERVTAGEVATIGIGDVWTIGTSLTIAGPGFGGVVAYLVVAGLLLSISPVLALIVLLGAPVIAVLVGPPLGRLREAGADYREHQSQLTSRLIDLVQGLRVLNGIGGKDRFALRYREKSRQLVEEGYRVGSVSSWIPTLGAGVPLLFLAVVTWLAARMAAEGSITVGDLVAVYGYVAVLVVPVAALIEDGSNVARAFVSARRVCALLQLGTEATEATEADGIGEGPPEPADLHDPESGVEVRVGCITALVGARPEDATTIIDRLGGLRSSAATWGGIRLAEVAPAQVRERILVADNEAAIFAGPLRDIVSGRFHLDDQAIDEALRAAVAEDIVTALPAGVSSIIASMGRNLSGGQRQRVRLARALAARPEVLLACDPTSAVDAHTEALIADRLRDARSGRTTLITTTSPLVLDRADVVHYLVDGRVAASGTHHDLLESRPDYRELVSRGLDEEHTADGAPARAAR